MPDDSEGDHLVTNAAELVAAAHAADGHGAGIDHAEPFVARGRISDLAPAAQSIQSILLVGGVTTWTFHIHFVSEHVHVKLLRPGRLAVNEFTPDFHGRARRNRVVPARMAVMADASPK